MKKHLQRLIRLLQKRHYQRNEKQQQVECTYGRITISQIFYSLKISCQCSTSRPVWLRMCWVVGSGWLLLVFNCIVRVIIVIVTHKCQYFRSKCYIYNCTGGVLGCWGWVRQAGLNPKP